jgi:hypothetical protein
MRRAAGVLTMLLAGACSAPPMHPDPGPPPEVGALEARVVVYRPGARNARRSYAVYDGEVPIGFLLPGRRIDYRCSPGARLFYLQGAPDAAVRAELGPGKTYYLRAGESPGWFSLKLLLEPQGPESGRREAEACGRVVADPEALADFRRRRGAEAAVRVDHYLRNPAECRPLDSFQGR